MDLVTVFAIAFGLAMDCFAVSVSTGITARTLKAGNALMMAFFFGAFQSLMPLAGWFVGLSVSRLISGFDHWIAFGLLGFVGAKMLFESQEKDKPEQQALGLGKLLLLSLATSIDALAIGLSFAFLKVPIALPLVIIGLVTFCVSLIGVALGKRLGSFFADKAELAGGLILIGIGAKILIEHLR